MSEMRLGGHLLDDCAFKWPQYKGAVPRYVEIAQGIDRAMELEALDRVTTLELEAPSEDGVNNPAHEPLVVQGVRVVEVVEIDAETCKVVLSDCRADIARRVCPTDANFYFRDGYIRNTYFPLLTDWIESVMLSVPELADSAAPDWKAAVADIAMPDAVPAAGPMLCHALDAVLSLVGAYFAVDAVDGLWRLRVPTSVVPFDPSAYAWVNSAEPSWAVDNRFAFGNAITLRSLYVEYHCIRLRFITGDATTADAYPDELYAELRQVYKTTDGYLELGDLLESFGFARDAITPLQIAGHLTGENFQNTQIEVGLYPNADVLVAILKRDFRSLFKIVYPRNGGASGAWTDWRFARFQLVEPEDGGPSEYEAVGAPVLAEYTEYLAKAEQPLASSQTSIVDVVVARDYRKRDNGGRLPVAPFSVAWDSLEEEVLRVSPAPQQGKQQIVWPGRMTGDDRELLTRLRYSATDDSGNTVDLPKEMLHVPTPSEVFLDEDFEMIVHVVARRRLPNSRDKWTAIDLPGVGNEVEVQEIEVGEELVAKRDYVDSGDPDHFPAADGMGQYLNLDKLNADAAQRLGKLAARQTVVVGGSGVAQGVSLALDVPVSGAIDEIRITVDYPVILTEVDVGPPGVADYQGRVDRKRRRAAARAVAHGGKVLA